MESPPVCGDQRREGDEACDDGNLLAGDGCSTSCSISRGWLCDGASPDVCRSVCGDGEVVARETCDDRNSASHDGCSDACQIEEGFACADGLCDAICGDGLVRGSETCDDQNIQAGDGCSARCVETGFWRPVPGSDVPSPRAYPSTTWTGREVVIFGGINDSVVSGGSVYDPATRAFRVLPEEGAPVARTFHTAFWTGSRVLIWGGASQGLQPLMDGALYDPVTRTWAPIPAAPLSPRYRPSVLWTGTEMIVWGGAERRSTGLVYLSDGARYELATKTWTPMETEGAPTARQTHDAVWTGTEMLIFGGNDARSSLAAGGIYDPARNTWRPMSTVGQPSPRVHAAAAWTGTEMIIWGGVRRSVVTTVEAFGDGARYDPVRDVWTPMSPVGAPTARSYSAAHWTGSELLIWGGIGVPRTADPAGDGALYLPATDSWIALSAENAPPARTGAGSTWTGTELVIFGGDASREGFFFSSSGDLRALGDGGTYRPSTRTWRHMVDSPSPGPRYGHYRVWTGTEMIIFGGWNFESAAADGGRLDPVSNTWRALPTQGAPTARAFGEAVWTGSEMIVWGGADDLDGTHTFDGGAILDPARNRWRPMSLTNAPSGRVSFSAVWTGTEMIVWGGGRGPAFFGDGASYDVARDQWTPLNPHPTMPRPRSNHTGVWTGTEMLIWGGADANGFFDDGALYDPSEGSWRELPRDGAPHARWRQGSVWTGTELLIFGGENFTGELRDGARYSRARDAWTPISQQHGLEARMGSKIVWTGTHALVWGGVARLRHPPPTWFGDGAIYHPASDTWTMMSTADAPPPRTEASALWTGSSLLIWGGTNGGSAFSNGGVFEY